jgi:SAM-dependent methyltransferase
MDDLYSLLRRLRTDGTVLDLGCGHGSFRYQDCPCRIVAVDVSLPDKTMRKRGATYVHADSACIPLKDGSIDAVISHHTLEHFVEYKKTLDEIRRILTPTGWLWIAVPNGSSFDDALYRRLYAGGGHVNRFAYQSLVDEVEKATSTKLAGSCDLFSSFIYVRPGDGGILAKLPESVLTATGFVLNVGTRILDKILGTRYSQYGWALVFARGDVRVEQMPSYFNVCRKCGAGSPAEGLKQSSKSWFWDSGFYHCPECGALNVLIAPPRSLL